MAGPIENLPINLNKDDSIWYINEQLTDSFYINIGVKENSSAYSYWCEYEHDILTANCTEEHCNFNALIEGEGKNSSDNQIVLKYEIISPASRKVIVQVSNLMVSVYVKPLGIRDGSEDVIHNEIEINNRVYFDVLEYKNSDDPNDLIFFYNEIFGVLSFKLKDETNYYFLKN